MAHAQDLFDVVTTGAVKIKVNQTYPLAEAARAHRQQDREPVERQRQLLLERWDQRFRIGQVALGLGDIEGRHEPGVEAIPGELESVLLGLDIGIGVSIVLDRGFDLGVGGLDLAANPAPEVDLP